MCGGMLGEAVGGIDRAANSINPMLKPMKWATDNTVSKVWKPAGQLYDYSNSHPLESLAAMAAVYGGAAGMGAAGGGSAVEGGAAAGAGEGTAMGGAAGTLGAADSAAGTAAAEGTAMGDAAGTLGAADSAAMGGTAEGTAMGSAAGTLGSADSAAGAAGTGGNFLSSIFGGQSGIGLNAATMKNAMGMMQLYSALYGMEQSKKLSSRASAQSVSNAGLQSVQRSMAAQGYQGSGNMMTALSKYGADAYGANLGQQQNALLNNMAGMGLLTAGMGNLAGWNNAPSTTQPTNP